MEELRQRIAALEAAVATAKEERAALPKEVPLRELMDETQIVRLEQERRRITDVIEMGAFRAETELASLVGPSLGFHHQDEARSFLENVFNLPADLLPDEEAGTLRVRLYGMANPRSNRALAELCEFLNDQLPTLCIALATRHRNVKVLLIELVGLPELLPPSSGPRHQEAAAERRRRAGGGRRKERTPCSEV